MKLLLSATKYKAISKELEKLLLQFLTPYMETTPGLKSVSFDIEAKDDHELSSNDYGDNDGIGNDGIGNDKNIGRLLTLELTFNNEETINTGSIGALELWALPKTCTGREFGGVKVFDEDVLFSQIIDATPDKYLICQRMLSKSKFDTVRAERINELMFQILFDEVYTDNPEKKGLYQITVNQKDTPDVYYLLSELIEYHDTEIDWKPKRTQSKLTTFMFTVS